MKLNDILNLPKEYGAFDIREFVPPQIWNRFKEQSVMMMDPKVFDIAVLYRTYFDVPIIINNWFIGGPYMYRGYRPPRVNVGAEFSQHKTGRAFDCHSPNISPQEMYKMILKDPQLFMDAGLTTLEDISFTKTWLHSDCRIVTTTTDILIVKPI